MATLMRRVPTEEEPLSVERRRNLQVGIPVALQCIPEVVETVLDTPQAVVVGDEVGR